jgi:Phospholipase_D-nuclease N-terminal
MDPGTLLAILVPLLAIQIVLIVVALRDLLLPERRVRGGNKGLWAVVILLGEILGPLLYFALGRENE